MSSTFLGSGLQFPMTAGNDGRVAMAYYEDCVHQAIWMILGTAKGERVMRPDFGCGMHELVFTTSDSTTLSRAAHEVREALIRWEPRVDVLEVSVMPDAAELGRLLVQVEYRVRTTNNRFNLVYPFYLE